jgi:hypothetical protein
VPDTDATTFEKLMTYLYKGEAELSLIPFERVIGLYYAGL